MAVGLSPLSWGKPKFRGGMDDQFDPVEKIWLFVGMIGAFLLVVGMWRWRCHRLQPFVGLWYTMRCWGKISADD
jgi:hypothetical protein